jgi:predicted kinase
VTPAPPILHLLIGLPGAGKTTLARQLEHDHAALRLTPDEWRLPLFGAGEAGDRRWLLESELLWGVAARALTLGVSVVLDYGCWSRGERELFRTRAAAIGARTRLHVLSALLDVLWPRIAARNRTAGPATPVISRAELEQWAELFEPPTADELAQWSAGQGATW